MNTMVPRLTGQLSGALLLVMGVAGGFVDGREQRLISGGEEVRAVRARAGACHGCTVECDGQNEEGLGACSGAIIETGCDQNWYCGAVGDGTRCGNERTVDHHGPYHHCVPNIGSNPGLCDTMSYIYDCATVQQCECNSWATDECQCGPYEYIVNIEIRGGCP